MKNRILTGFVENQDFGLWVPKRPTVQDVQAFHTVSTIDKTQASRILGSATAPLPENLPSGQRNHRKPPMSDGDLQKFAHRTISANLPKRKITYAIWF